MATAARSQVAISPYSHYGLGDIFSTSRHRNFGMGRIGIGAYDQSSINQLNPASYADLRLTTFDFNGFATYSKQSSNINEQGLSTSGFHNAVGLQQPARFWHRLSIAPTLRSGMMCGCGTPSRRHHV
ncbi:MAG: hypothetical protein IPP17_19400 [Bacteroidetes bacterium]|nr:hypothetical protein [Bacteroidota bacterium]